MPPRHSLFIAATTLALLVNGCGRKPCPTGLVACGPTCIDPMTAPGHCVASADCKGANAGVVCSGDQVCSAGQCKSNNARLSALVLSGAELTPAFTSATNTYTAHLSMCASATTVTATTAEPQTQLIINGGTAGIGGNQADNGTTDSGAVYIFTRSGASWSQQAYVKASNPDAYDKFGRSVSLTQAGDTLAVGAHQEKSSATGMNGDQADNTLVEAGAVYVFTRSGTSWSQQAYVKASNTNAGDAFGSSLTLAGDVLAVGAPGEASSSTGPGANQADNSASSSGAVYLFERSDETWAQRAYLKASNPGANDSFGSSVALAAGTLLVGARQESSNATGINGTQMNDDAPNSGAAYSFACY